MGDRNIGAEILDGIQEIKQFKKGDLTMRTKPKCVTTTEGGNDYDDSQHCRHAAQADPSR